MADLPASTAAVVENNGGSLSDLVQTALTKLTVGVNLTPLSWILLAELLILGIVASIFAVRLVQRRRNELINAIAQMIEHYTRRMDGYIELQQKYLEEQFHLDPEKAALLSDRMQQNQQTFLRTLTQVLADWDMHRFSRIHMELEQFNHDQLTSIAEGFGLNVQSEATEEDVNPDGAASAPDRDSDEPVTAETAPQTEIEAEQEFEFSFEEETPPAQAPDSEPEEERLEFNFDEKKEETLEFNFDEKEEETFDFNFDEPEPEPEQPEPAKEIEIPAPKTRHRNEEIDLLVPDNPEIILDDSETAAGNLSADKPENLDELEIVMAKDMGSLNHPNPIRKKKKTQ